MPITPTVSDPATTPQQFKIRGLNMRISFLHAYEPSNTTTGFKLEVHLEGGTLLDTSGTEIFKGLITLTFAQDLLPNTFTTLCQLFQEFRGEVIFDLKGSLFLQPGVFANVNVETMQGISLQPF